MGYSASDNGGNSNCGSNEEETSMKKALGVAFVLALLLSAVALLQFVSLAKANPVPYPPTPNTELPTITVQTPQNYSDIYAENSVILNFSVTKPDSWNRYHLGIPVIGDYQVFVYLDSDLFDTFLDPRPYEQLTRDYSLVLNGLTSELHTLKIDVRARTFYKITKAAEDPLEHFMNTSATIHFNIIADHRMILFNVDETVAIPEFPSWTILPLFLIATFLALSVRKKLFRPIS
jgi:hypothetical protein